MIREKIPSVSPFSKGSTLQIGRILSASFVQISGLSQSGLMLDYDNKLRLPARQLRKQQTPAERLLWSHLRRKQINHRIFYRQKPLGHFIVDFYCPAAALVIELDGAHHSEIQQAAYDTERDHQLKELGLRVVRFSNRQVIHKTESVLREIRSLVQSHAPSL